jgi:hypothetical protein
MTQTTRRSALAALAAAPAAATLNAQATPTPTEWQAKYDRYRCLRALSEASEDFGPITEANQQWDAFKYTLEAKYGSWERAKKSEPEACDQAWEKVWQAEMMAYNTYGLPMELAAIELMHVPAPNIDAALLKVQIAKQHELDNHSRMGSNPFDLVREDLARLTPGGLPTPEARQ